MAFSEATLGAIGTAAGGIGSSLVGGLISGISSSRAAKKAYKYNRELIHMQQAWQERMSNTAHQREVSDLRKAGLNPILSATGGSGASFGSASAPGMSVEPADFGDLGVSSALAIRQQKNQNKLANSQIDLNDKSGKKAESDTVLNSAIAEKTNQDKLNSINLTQAEIDLKREQIENLKEERKYIKYNAETGRASANAQGISAGASARDVDNKIKSDAYGSPIGRAYNSAKKIYRDFTTTNKYGRSIKKGIDLFNKYAPGINQIFK